MTGTRCLLAAAQRVMPAVEEVVPLHAALGSAGAVRQACTWCCDQLPWCAVLQSGCVGLTPLLPVGCVVCFLLQVQRQLQEQLLALLQ
jgi:hypothetical protein